MIPKKGISVIVCCFNAVNRIVPTLSHLARQNVHGRFPVEVIIVDNASTDTLADSVNDCWANEGMPYPLKIVSEPKSGLMYARMRGVESAEYSYGIFCDDDNWLQIDYFSKIFDWFELDESIGVIGGASIAAFESVPPPWFYSKCDSFAVGTQGLRVGYVTDRKFVWGAGMGFRVMPLRRIYYGGIDPLTSGRKGASLASGDDSEICAWFIFAGYELWYDPECQFQHFIPKERLTSAYYQRLFEVSYPSHVDIYGRYLWIKYGLPGNGVGLLVKSINFVRKIRAAIYLIRNLGRTLDVNRVENMIIKLRLR